MNEQSYYQNGPRFDPQTGQPIRYPAPPEKPSYSASEIVFAWISLLAGYAFCRVFPVVEHPFGGLLFIWAMFVSAAVILKLRGASFGLMPVALGVSALALSPALFLSANSMIHFLVYLYALTVWCYFISGSTGNLLERGFSDLLAVDLFKAVLVMPFTALGMLFPALFSGRGKGSGKSFLKILLGIGIAIVPTAVVLALLSYDSGFVALYKRFFDVEWTDLFSHLFSFLFGVPIGMYFYGLFYAAEKHKCAETFTAGGCRAAAASMKVLPGLTAIAASVPVLTVYGVFFASQWDYYISAFTGVLPDATTFAEYARSGFFQLCTVSVINLMIIVLLQLFVRRKEQRPAPVTRILSVLFSAATLVLISTAIAKLWMYIDRFGLTPKRVYAGWFMLMLAAVFVLVLLKQLLIRFKLLPTATLVCVVMFGVLALSGSDARIAEYNVDRYLNGTLETIDVAAMERLGDAAVRPMVRLVQELDRRNGTDITAFDPEAVGDDQLYDEVAAYLYRAADSEPYTLYSFTLPRARAEASLSAAGIKK